MESEPRKPLNDADLKFAEAAVGAVNDFEKHYGGPRFEEDLVSVVRGLVTAQREARETLTAMQKTQEMMQQTQAHMMAAIDGKPFGDRQDGLIARTAALERERRRRAIFNSTLFGMITTIFGRSLYVDFQRPLDGFWRAFMATMGTRGH